MGNGRKSVCFDVLDEPVSPQVRLCTKNTFVSFVQLPIDTSMRRHSMTGGLIQFRRGSSPSCWSEEDVGAAGKACARPTQGVPRCADAGRVRKQVDRGNSRAKTSPAKGLSERLRTLAAAEKVRASNAFAPAPRTEEPAAFKPRTCVERLEERNRKQAEEEAQLDAEEAKSCFTGSVWRLVNGEPPPQSRRPARRRAKAAPEAKAHELTLMMRFLPLDLTPTELFERISAYVAHMDFYYLPTNFETGKNLGYAFVNMTDKAVATEFMQFWRGLKISESESEDMIQAARVQGFGANVMRFQNSAMMNVLPPETQPRVFEHGVRVPFPRQDPEKKVTPIGPRFKPTGSKK